MCLIANRRQSNMPVSVIIVHQGENVYFLAQMRTECVLQYQKSTHCVPNVNFADLFGSTGLTQLYQIRLKSYPQYHFSSYQLWILKMG